MTQLTKGFNHVAIVSKDFDRLADFYRHTFGVEAFGIEEETRNGLTLRHGFLRLGPTSAVHVFEFPEAPTMSLSTEFFHRGRVDHVAIEAADEDAFEAGRQRLVEAGASTGEIQDWGVVKSVYFEDPDGLPCEFAFWKPAA